MDLRGLIQIKKEWIRQAVNISTKFAKFSAKLITISTCPIKMISRQNEIFVRTNSPRNEILCQIRAKMAFMLTGICSFYLLKTVSQHCTSKQDTSWTEKVVNNTDNRHGRKTNSSRLQHWARYNTDKYNYSWKGSTLVWRHITLTKICWHVTRTLIHCLSPQQTDTQGGPN